MLNAILQSAPFIFLTQSVWRDEAYSALIAQKPISIFFQLSFEPPLYYITLHYWIKFFGSSEIAIRSLSLIAFLTAVYAVGKIAKKMYGDSWLSLLLPLVFFLNPMIFYYAFEARAYGLYLAFTAFSTLFYFEKKWTWYVLFSVLGLYTHAYMVFVILVQCMHYALEHRKKIIAQIRQLHKNPFVRSVLAIIIFYLPWVIHILLDLPRLRQSWYFPVDERLVRSVLGNIFLGYEGTPWNLWLFMERVSLVILTLTLISVSMKKNREYTSYFFLLLYVPLIIILFLSFYKPFYVMRYMIPSVIAAVFLVVTSLTVIKNGIAQKIAGLILCSFLIGFTIWFAPYHKKLDMKNIMAQINTSQRKNDVILVDDALILYEAMYYNKSKAPIYWYNPNNSTFPWYIGDHIIQKNQIQSELPPYPYRAFLIHLNGEYEIIFNAPISQNHISKPNSD